MARVFICDDDPALVASLREWLKGQGHHAFTDSHAMEMLRAVAARPDAYDLVILGADKVGIAGTYATEIIKQISPFTRVAVIHRDPASLSPTAVPPGRALVIDRVTPLAELTQSLREELGEALASQGTGRAQNSLYLTVGPPGAPPRPGRNVPKLALYSGRCEMGQIGEIEDTGLRALVVDDEEEIRDFLTEYLTEEFGFVCADASSGEEGLERIAEGAFHLVFSDITMGGMTGIEMVTRLKGLAPDAVVVMISGLGTIDSAIEAMRAGAHDYVTKPFNVDQVDAAVHRAVAQSKVNRAKTVAERELQQSVERAEGTIEDTYRSTLKALAAALEKRDLETGGHSERVVRFSLRIGQQMGLDLAEMRSLEYGALLHDIGKIGVPDAILKKPAALTEDEWQQMRKHPLHGQQILSGIDFLEGAARVVGQHHEKWDGSGYPLGLKGEEIDLNARIFAVADAFDAMISDRVYRRGRSYDAALSELKKCVGAHFDPAVVDAFEQIAAAEWEHLRNGVTAVAA